MTMNPLQQLIADSLAAQGLSQRQAVARSGGLLTTATMSRIASGITVNLTARTIQGLAVALDLKPSTVRAAAEATAMPQAVVSTLKACAGLPPDQLADIEAYAQAKLKAHIAAEKARIAAERPFRRGGSSR